MQPIGPRSFWMDSAPAVEPLRLRRVPMLLAAGGFALGDLFARQWHGAMLLLVASVLLFALAAAALRWGHGVAVAPVFGVWVAVGCWCATMQPPLLHQRELRSYADGLSRTLHGHVVRVRTLRSTPIGRRSTEEGLPWKMEPGAWDLDDSDAREAVDLAVDSVEEVTPDLSWFRPITGGVRLTVLGPSPPVHCGDGVEVPVRLRLPEVYRDPGAWSYNDQLLSEGIGSTASVKAGRMEVIRSSTAGFACRLSALQGWASGKFERLAPLGAAAHLPSLVRLDGDDTAMLAAMLFGDRARLRPSLRVGFERTGTFHLFVVSGLHVTLLAAAVFGWLRKLRLPEVPAVVLTLLLTLGYALLTGWGAPVQRALLMTAAYLLGRALGRESSGLNALGIALLALLAMNPRVLFEAGFQMTSLVIIAVAGLAVPLAERWMTPSELALHRLENVALDASFAPWQAQFRVRLRMWSELAGDLFGTPWRRVPAWTMRGLLALAEALLFGAAIEVCMILPMAVYFHRATLLALPVNLFAIPLVGVLLGAALLTFLGALLGGKLALVPGGLTALLLHAVRRLVDHVSRFSLADVRMPTPAPVVLLAAGALLLFCCLAFRARRRVWLISGLAAAALVPALVLLPEPPLLHPGLLEVTAIDVGQGDSLLVVSPQGRTMLVDAGGPNGRSPSPDRWDVGEEVVAPYLWSRRLRRLDVVMLSHAHSDHMGGMPAILADLHPRELWVSVTPGEAPDLLALLAQARALGIAVRRLSAGDSETWGGTSLNVLAPDPGYTNPGEPSNDDSLVVRLSFGKASALLTGDAEGPSEQAMLLSGRLAPVTLLKVGHHGSQTSTHPDFLAALAPAAAVISVGSHNTFGHPRREVLRRLEDAHVATWRTDRAGAHTFLLAADGTLRDASAN